MRSEVRGAISEGTVHELLAHLRDGVYLQQHPLAQLLVAAPGKRGEALRELLLGLLERLKPEPGTPLGDPACGLTRACICATWSSCRPGVCRK